MADNGSLWWVGLLLDCVAALAGAIGKQLLRHAAVSRNRWFIPLGLCFTAIIDPAFDLLAYSFAAQSIIAAAAGLARDGGRALAARTDGWAERWGGENALHSTL